MKNDKNKLLKLRAFFTKLEADDMSKWCEEHGVMFEKDDTGTRIQYAYTLVFRAKDVYQVAKAIEDVRGVCNLKTI